MLDKPDPLAAAKAQRAVLGERMAQLHAQRDRLREAIDAEHEPRAELDALNRREVDAMKAWAAGSTGSPPRPDAKERARLTAILAQASATADAARAAIGDVERDLGEVNRQAAALVVTIGDAAIDAMLNAFAQRWAGIEARAEVVRTDIAGAFAILRMLREQAEHFTLNAEMARGTALHRRLSAVEEGLGLDLSPSLADVNAAVPDHARRLAELCR